MIRAILSSSRSPLSTTVLMMIKCIMILSVVFTLLGQIKCEDYYKLLGVPKNADKSQIKRAFRKLAVKYHPDRNKGDKSANDKFIKISKAYEVLTDDEKRSRYDRFGEEGLSGQRQQRGGGDPFDVFSSFFGGGDDSGFHFSFGGDNSQMNEEEEFKGEDMRIPLKVTLEDLYNGKVLDFKRVRTAHPEGAKPRECQCRNRVIRMVMVNGRMQRTTENNCAECKDRFEVITKKSEITIDIEKGTNDGEEILIFGEGDASTSSIAGDLIFIIQAAQHGLFTRKGDDLFMKKVVTLNEALTGFSLKIKHLDGRDILLKVEDEIIKPNYVKTIYGEGMPSKNDSSRKGNLHITFDVIFPSKQFTSSQKKSLRSIL